jgi:hypothetical protein
MLEYLRQSKLLVQMTIIRRKISPSAPPGAENRFGIEDKKRINSAFTASSSRTMDVSSRAISDQMRPSNVNII